MGKVSNTPEFLSQKDYDSKLNDDIGKLIDKGFSDEDVTLYGEDFKTRYAVKKKENTTSQSENTELDILPTENLPSSESQKNVDLFKSKEFENFESKRDNTNLQTKTLKFSKPFFKSDGKEITPIPENEFDTILEDVKKEAEQRIIDRDNRIQSNIQSFRDKTKLTDEDNLTIKKRFDSEKEVSTFEKFVDGTFNFFKAVSGVPKSVIEESKTIPFDKEIKQVKRNAKKNNVELTDKEVLKKAEELFIETEKDNIFNDKANAFLSDIDPVSKGEVQGLLNTSIKGLSEENKKLSVSNVALKDVLISGQKQLEEKADALNKNPNNITEQDVLEFNDLRNDLIEKSNVYNRNQEKLISNTKDLQPLEKEYDLFRRSYDGVFIENFAVSTSELIVGGIDFVNFLGQFSGAPSSAQPLFDTSTIREELKRDRNNIRKPIQNVESVEGFLNYTSDLVANQLLTLVATSTGYGGLAVIGASSTGQKYAEMTDDIKSGKANYETWQMMLVPIGHGSAEAIFEIPTLSILNKGKRVLGSALKGSPNLFRASAKETFKSFGTDFLKENLSEQATNLIQNGLNIYALGQEGNLSDNALDVFKDTTTMTLLLQGSPHIMSKALQPFQSKDNLRILEENAFEMQNLYSDLKNTEITNTEKQLIENQIEKLTENSSEIMRSVISDVSEMDDSTRNEIFEINKKAGKLIFQAKEIQKNGKSKNKQKLIDIISNEYNLLQEKREKVVSDFSKKGRIQYEIDGEKINTDNVGLNEFLSDDNNVRSIIDGNINISITNDEKASDLLDSRIEQLKESQPKIESTVTEEANSFAEQLGNQEDVSQFVKGATKIAIGNTDVIIKSEGDNIKIESISTSQDNRGQGSAKNAIQKVTEVADKDGKTLELNVVPLDDKTDAQQLVNFYEGQGFIKEQGFSLDGGKMVRQPRSTENFFNPLESEGESLGRLFNNISENKTIDEVAKEHTDSYLKYLNQQKVDKNVLDSEFVNTFKERLTEALGRPNDFDFNQERSQQNGSRIDEKGEVIKEEDYLKEQGSLETDDGFSAIDSIISETVEPTSISTQLNDYTVEVKDGELDIIPKFGNSTPSTPELRKITKQYIENTDFDKGERVDFSEKGNLSQDQISDIIATESNNAVEIAQEIVNIKESVSNNNNSIQDSKTGAIAQALNGVQVNKESFSQVDDKNNIDSVNPFYFNSRNKNKTGDSGLIDNIRENAQQFTNENVELQDVTDFIKEYRNPNDILENENQNTFDLESKFKEITGLKATDSNIESVLLKSKPNQDQEVSDNNDSDNDVPFQTESNQERISGKELNNLVNRLKKTGLANDVKILSDQQTNSFLKNLGINDLVQKQSEQDQENERLRQRPKVLELRRKLRNEGFLVDDIIVSKTDYGVSTYINFTDSNDVLREFRISNHPVFNPDRIKNEYHYDLSTDLQKIIRQVKSDISENTIKSELTAEKIREQKADEKWERVKKAFDGLAFKRVTNVPTSFPKFRNKNGGIRTNIFRQDSGKGLYNYEWTEPIGNIKRKNPVTKPTIEYIESLNEDTIIEGIKFQKDISDNNIEITPNGFVHNDIVYLNRDKVKKDTAIHEFGHLWNSYAKKNDTIIYSRGLQLMKDSEYLKQVENNPAYNHLSLEGKLEEALAQAIGEKGVKILNESKKAKFNTWFKNLFTKIAKGLGIRSLNSNQLSNITLDKFTDLVSAELLSGQEIKPITRPSTPKNKINDADVSNIDLVISEQIAIKETKDKLLQKFRDRDVFAKDIKSELVSYIQSNLDSKRVSDIQKSELNKLLNLVKKARTKKNLLTAFNKVNEIVTSLDNKNLKKKIDSILKKKFSKRESGRRKANITDEQTEKILNKIKENISDLKSEDISTPFKPTTTNRINERLDNLYDIREALQLNDGDLSEIEAVSISINILNALNTKDVNNANDLLNESLADIESIFNDGRSLLKEARENRRLSDEVLLSGLETDANPEQKTTNKSIDSLKNENQNSGNVVARTLQRSFHNWFRGRITASLDSIATIISKKGGENRDSSSWVQFVNRLKRQETFKKARIRKFANKWKDTQKSIFGSVTKADKLLNKFVEIEVDVTPKQDGFRPENNSDIITEKVRYTYSQLLNVWQNNHNEKLRSGLANNGFTQDVISKIDEILPEKVKDYGNALFDLYEQMYIDSNDVYKSLNFHSLGKPPAYAGKVHREGVSVKEDTNALLGGVTNINTTGYGSQKERLTNDNPINAVDVNLLFSRSLQESSHYVAFAEVHRLYNKILKDDNVQKAILLNNGKSGDQILKSLLYYKIRDVEQGGERGNKVVDALGRNIARSVLGLKAKIGITQTISIVNGSFDLPRNMRAKDFIENYNPAEILKNIRFLLKNSDYMQNRYDVGGLENAVLGLDSITKQSSFSFDNSSLESKRRASARFYKQATDFLLLNVKYGDMVGVLGATPVYSAWKSKYLKDGFSEEQANKKALSKFESSVDRAQQSISAFGKSEIQKHPYLRYLMMFATAPIQNLQNANFHRRELVKGLRGQESKGSNVRNAVAFMNYQFAQPMLYTYISNILAGGLISAIKGLGNEEEESTDADKALLSSAILGNVQSVPLIGGILLYTIDKVVLQKEHTFANIIGSPLYDEIKKTENNIKKAIESENPETKKRHIFQAIKKTSGILGGIPNFSFDVFNEWDDVYWNDDISTESKVYRALGYSKIVIEKKTSEKLSKKNKKRNTRATKEEAQERRDKAKEKRKNRN